jgi:hypothetical protein
MVVTLLNVGKSPKYVLKNPKKTIARIAAKNRLMFLYVFSISIF